MRRWVWRWVERLVALCLLGFWLAAACDRLRPPAYHGPWGVATPAAPLPRPLP